MGKPRISLKKAIAAVENPEKFFETDSSYADYIKVIAKEETKRRRPKKGELEKIILATILNNLSEKDSKKRFEELEERLRCLEQIVHQSLTKIDFSNEADLDAIISNDASLKKFCDGKKLSLTSKRLLIQNRLKIGKLYKDGQHKTTVQEYSGSLNITDKKIADEILE